MKKACINCVSQCGIQMCIRDRALGASVTIPTENVITHDLSDPSLISHKKGEDYHGNAYDFHIIDINITQDGTYVIKGSNEINGAYVDTHISVAEGVTADIIFDGATIKNDDKYCPYVKMCIRDRAFTDFTSIEKTFGQCFTADFGNVRIFDFIVVLLSFLFVDMFDTIGTLIGVSSKAGMLDKDEKLPRIKPALLADAIATSVGAIFGTSTTTTFVESSAGVGVGARTGLASVVTGFLDVYKRQSMI